jgi:hypothetical protein
MRTGRLGYCAAAEESAASAAAPSIEARALIAINANAIEGRLIAITSCRNYDGRGKVEKRVPAFRIANDRRRSVRHATS